MTELDRLQKEINGKLVRLIADDGLNINCILLWPPGGVQVSAKPYGYTDKEISNLLSAQGYNGYTEAVVSDPQFCISSYRIMDEGLPALKYIADIQQEGILDDSEIDRLVPPTPSQLAFDKAGLGSSPSCPYG